MKKLLVPSLLAGLMICIPVHESKAQPPFVGYTPTTYETIGINTLNTYTSGGVAFSETFMSSPGPAGLQTNWSFSANAPSGVGGSDYGFGLDTTTSVWSWVGGGTPSSYDDFCTIQATLNVNCPNSATPPAFSSGAELDEFNNSVVTDVHSLNLRDYGLSLSGNNGYPYQDLISKYGNTGKTSLRSDFSTFVFGLVWAIGTTGQLSYTSQSTATYVIP